LAPTQQLKKLHSVRGPNGVRITEQQNVGAVIAATS
jgi:hypothetical protein